MTQNVKLSTHQIFKTDLSIRLLHYGILATVIGLGVLLRFSHLDAKALWLDEVIGALFSFGKALEDVPLNQFFDFASLNTLFSLDSHVSCLDIARAVSTDSVHPPIYFCFAHQWLRIWNPNSDNWIWVLRSLSALIGVACIPALYGLNRLAFSPAVGLLGAALMAVSPFAVYLSQEARHYTLPMLTTLLTLTIAVKFQKAIVKGRPLPRKWLFAWTVLNSVGMYIHYFYILVVIAQIVSIGGILIWKFRFETTPSSSKNTTRTLVGLKRVLLPVNRMRQHLARFGLAIALLIISFLPWLPILVQHFGRPETDWLKPYNPDWSDRIAPIYQMLSNWILMVIALPIEDQSWGVIIPSALGMLVIGGWIFGRAVWGLHKRWQDLPEQRPSILLLGIFVGVIILEFLGITYLLDKDVTSVPRYSFVYYPGMVALIAAGLSYQRQRSDIAGFNLANDKSNGIGRSDPYTAQLNQDIQGDTHKSQYGLDSLYGSVAKSHASRKLTKSAHSILKRITKRQTIAIALIVGFISSLLVVYGFVFQKGYYPQKVAADLTFESHLPVMLVVSYQSLQEVGLGLSFALELQKVYSNGAESSARIAFIERENGFREVWRSLSRLRHDLSLPINLWVVASPGMKTKDYPELLTVRHPERKERASCLIDPKQFNRIGFPYQLFRCS